MRDSLVDGGGSLTILPWADDAVNARTCSLQTHQDAGSLYRAARAPSDEGLIKRFLPHYIIYRPGTTAWYTVMALRGTSHGDALPMPRDDRRRSVVAWFDSLGGVAEQRAAPSWHALRLLGTVTHRTSGKTIAPADEATQCIGNKRRRSAMMRVVSASSSSLAALALALVEHGNHKHALLLALAAVRRAARCQHLPADPARATQLERLPLPVHRALRRVLEATIPVRHARGHRGHRTALCLEPGRSAAGGMPFCPGSCLFGMLRPGQLERQFLLHPDVPALRLEPIALATGRAAGDVVGPAFEAEFSLLWLHWHPDADSLLLGARGVIGRYDISTGALREHHVGVPGHLIEIRWTAAGPLS